MHTRLQFHYFIFYSTYTFSLFVQPSPLHSPHICVHLSPCLRQPHLIESHPVLQLLLMTFKNSCGPGGRVALIGKRRFSFEAYHPHSRGPNSSPSQCCTWWYIRMLCRNAASGVGGSFYTWRTFVSKDRLPSKQSKSDEV